MAAQASWSGKFQIDGGQSLVLGNQVPLGGSASLPVSLPAYQPAGKGGTPAEVKAVTTVQVLATADKAQMLAIQADKYKDSTNGKLTLTFQDAAKTTTTPLDLTGDLLIANASLLSAICKGWVSVEVNSTIQQAVIVQILVVWNL